MEERNCFDRPQFKVLYHIGIHFDGCILRPKSIDGRENSNNTKQKPQNWSQNGKSINSCRSFLKNELNPLELPSEAG